MSAPILLVHGWGFRATFWDPLVARLPDFAVETVDLGFFGPARRPTLDCPLVVAHSMGLPWALAHIPRPWSGVVAVNAFARFTRDTTFVEGVAPRMIERMQTRFADDPAQVTGDFLRRCGIEAPDLAGLKAATLGPALDWLATCDQRAALDALGAPVQALAGTRDQIVPESMSRAAFAYHPLVLAEGAGHLLPLTHPDWVAAYVRLAAARSR